MSSLLKWPLCFYTKKKKKLKKIRPKFEMGWNLNSYHNSSSWVRMTKKKVQKPKKQTRKRFEKFVFLTIMGVASSISVFWQICLIFNTVNGEVIVFRFFFWKEKTFFEWLWKSFRQKKNQSWRLIHIFKTIVKMCLIWISHFT